jgi:hypothetical protein
LRLQIDSHNEESSDSVDAAPSLQQPPAVAAAVAEVKARQQPALKTSNNKNDEAARRDILGLSDNDDDVHDNEQEVMDESIEDFR